MDSGPDLPASGDRRKTIFMSSCPISILCTRVRITSRLRCQSAFARSGPDGCREFTKPRHCESHVLHLVDIARVSLSLSVKLSDAAPGSSHARRELIL